MRQCSGHDEDAHSRWNREGASCPTSLSDRRAEVQARQPSHGRELRPAHVVGRMGRRRKAAERLQVVPLLSEQWVVQRAYDNTSVPSGCVGRSLQGQQPRPGKPGGVQRIYED